MPVRLPAGTEVEHGTNHVVGQMVGGDDDGAIGGEKRAGVRSSVSGTKMKGYPVATPNCHRDTSSVG
jgi:hypothetical protein